MCTNIQQQSKNLNVHQIAQFVYAKSSKSFRGVAITSDNVDRCLGTHCIVLCSCIC